MSKIMTPEGVLNSVVEGINKGDLDKTWNIHTKHCCKKSDYMFQGFISYRFTIFWKAISAGVMRLHFWPIRDFEKQIEIFRKEIASHY